MKLTLNGDEHDLPERCTLTQALEHLGIVETAGIAVAVEAEVVPAAAWDSTTLRGGERVEVLRAVQGG